MISVVLPTLNDALRLRRALHSLEPLRGAIEVIVVDGGSEDGTLGVAEGFKWVRVVASPPGRAVQMNHGAAAAQADILLFLHADTCLEGGWPEAVERAVARPGFAIGAFRFRLDARGFGFRAIESAVRLRNVLFRLPYGDQGLFLCRRDFEEAGGYRPIPLMEDVELVRAMRKRGRVVLLTQGAVTSARNWERDGLTRRTLRNWATYLRYRLGTPPERLLAGYRGRRWALVVFCKRPEAGRVKTRLAADVGAERAVALYRQTVGHTQATAAQCPGEPEMFVFFDPPEARDDIARWLGPGHRYIAQSKGDLGQRMLHAFGATRERGFTDTLIIGTDCPALKPEHLGKAFAALRHHDVVLGPTPDGGYYLIGARRPHPVLFEGIPWSTGGVLDSTREALRAAGLRYVCLAPLRDLDTQEDLEHHVAVGALPDSVQTPNRSV